jgi:uncharacterized caspase-like protein
MPTILKRIFLALFILTLFNPPLLPAATEQRTALVIGNGNYPSARLINPVNDATDMAATLKRLGFTVILKINARHQEMEEAIRDFGNRLKRGGVGLFFYAGHGLQISGQNYLIPIGARINRETEVKFQAVDAEMILDEMANAGNDLNIVILDACRDNPFSRSFRSAGRGLAIIPTAPKGSFVTYSTSPGKVAADGSGRNSPYTAALLKFMVEPGLPIEQVFKKARNKLDAETKGQQIPWELSSLRGDFYFNIKEGGEPTPTASMEQKVIASVPLISVIPSADRQPDNYFSLLARDGWNEALTYFQKTTTSSPDDMDARAGLTVAQVLKGDEDNARYNIRRIKESSFESRWTRVAIGLVEGLGENYENGVYQLNRALEDGADGALVNLCIGIIAERKGKWDIAQKAVNNYQTLVPDATRGQPFKSLAKHADVKGRLTGSYYFTGPDGVANAAHSSVMIIAGSGNDIKADVISPADNSKFILSDVRVENNKLIFKARNEAGGFLVGHFWNVAEYIADLKDDLKKIPWIATQIEGNVGQNGTTYRGFLIRKPSH